MVFRNNGRERPLLFTARLMTIRCRGIDVTDKQFIDIEDGRELRCPNCDKLLAKGAVGYNGIEIKCSRCKMLCRFQRIG